MVAHVEARLHNPNPRIPAPNPARSDNFSGQPRDKSRVSFAITDTNRALNRRSPVTRAILRALAALAIVLAFALAPAAAQTGQMFGELVGKVTDDQGGVLPGVTVTLSGPAVIGAPPPGSGTTGVYRLPADPVRRAHDRRPRHSNTYEIGTAHL